MTASSVMRSPRSARGPTTALLWISFVLATPAGVRGDTTTTTADTPTSLQLEYMVAPSGVDRTVLHFTWALPLGSRTGSTDQVAAQVRVISNASQGVAFDSGKVATSQPEFTNHLPHEPAALQSDAVYTWTVTVWTRGGATLTSPPAVFTTGFVHNQSEWRGKWIRGGTQMRKEFVVSTSTNVVRATLFISACQYYNAYLDGERVDTQVLAPWTSFYTNRSYDTLAVDPARLSPGVHVLGVRVGQGFCTSAAHDAWDVTAERSAIVQLQLHGAAAAGAEQPLVQTVLSDETWTASSGPILQDSTYFGEVYDAREEQPGWANPGFVPPTGHLWTAVLTNFTVVAHLASQLMPPVTAVHRIPAVSINTVTINVTQQPCAEAAESVAASVDCNGGTIASIAFLDFGQPVGSCSSGFHSSPNCTSAANLTAFVSNMCVGQESCSVACTGRVPPPYLNGQCTVSNMPAGQSTTFVEGEPCGGFAKTLALQVVCGPPKIPQSKVKYVYDFGQEFAGVVEITLPPNTPAGTIITLKYAEALAHPPLAPADGSVYMGNLFWCNPVDVYTAKGGIRAEVYLPAFTYHGFRY